MADLDITVRRIARKADYTISRWYINGKYFCDGIEDRDRGLHQNMSEEAIAQRKVYGKTAIPMGTYDVIMSYSPKFAKRPWAKPYNGRLPLLRNVKGFSGVRIHVGNTASDSLGCLLPGQNKVVGKVVNSTATFHELMKVFILPVLNRGDKIYLTIK